MLNYSKQREQIYNLLLQSYSHPTASEVYNMVRKSIANISRGTVYRNLSQLVRQGIVKRLDIDNMQSRFDAHIEEHAHFKCVKCGRLLDVKLNCGELSKSYEQASGNIVLNNSIIFEGICKTCQDSNITNK